MNSSTSEFEPCYPPHGTDLSLLLEERVTEKARSVLDAVKRCSERSDVPAYLVGGPVRDILLGRSVTDIDLVVEGDGIGFAGKLADAEEGKVVAYSRFGTALVLLPVGIKVDVTTARQERYVRPGVLPSVAPDRLDADLRRRDFSINAMAVRLGPDGCGLFIDIYGGIRDLANGSIRVMHEESFRDDPTRILRAIRFETRYRFSIESRTWDYLLEAVKSNMLDEVSRQRLRTEIVTVLKEDMAHEAVMRISESGVWQMLFGTQFRLPAESAELFDQANRAIAWYSRLAQEHRLVKAEPWLVRWLILISSISSETGERITREFHLGSSALKCVREFIEFVSSKKLCQITDDQIRESTLYKNLFGLSPETLISIAVYSGRDDAYRKIKQFLLELRPISVWVNGDDLKEMGLPEGPLLGTLLERLFAEQLDGNIKTRANALEEAQKLIDRQNDAS